MFVTSVSVYLTVTKQNNDFLKKVTFLKLTPEKTNKKQRRKNLLLTPVNVYLTVSNQTKQNNDFCGV